MKIAQVSPLFESVPPTAYGGTERIVSYLTEELVRQGHDVTLFASGDSVTEAQLVPICQTSLRAAPKPPEPTAQGLITLESVFSIAEEFDIIHCHVDYLAFPFIRRSQGKGISTMHGRLDIEGLQGIYNQYGDIPLVSISNAQRRPMPGLNWRERIFHGLPEDLYRFNDKPDPYLCFIGRVTPEKGIEEAIATANKAGIPLKIGAKVDQTDREYYETKVKPLLDRSPLVEFLGELNQHDKEKLMRGAMGQLFPTMCNESFGLVMIEAMACGTPVIATPFGSVPEVIEEGLTGTICTTVDQAVAACKKLDTYDRRAIREQFENRFSARIMASNYVNLFEELIEQRQDNDLTRARNNKKNVFNIGTRLMEKVLPEAQAAGGSRRSMVSLDLLNFFLGPVRGGAGTYVAYYFAAMRHFDAASIGMMLGIMSVSLAVSQIPAGVFVDRITRWREFTAIALGIIASGWALMILYPALPVVLGVQLIVGSVCALFAPMVASLTLGLVGYENLDRRVGRNAVFANAGNVATAVLIAALTQFYGGNITLFVLAAFAMFAAASSLGIKNSDVNLEVMQTKMSTGTSKLASLLSGVNVFTKIPSAGVFAVVAALYTFANASMLPLMVQYISRRSVTQTAVELPTALLLTEFVMIPAALFTSRQAWAGRKPLLALSFITLIIRGASFAFVTDPGMLVALQIFDGISAGIFTVLMTLILADVTRGTGRFSSSISALAMLISLTNAASEYLCGIFAASMGFGFAFGSMTLIAALGFVIMLAFMPETCVAKSKTNESEDFMPFPSQREHSVTPELA